MKQNRTTDHKHTNRLIHESSPYLLQHAHNPVDWYPWGDEALASARKRNVPIFLSIGYSACHWCHVMEHESFEDENIATLLNENFISIKVDREERPDIDDIYMTAVQLMTGTGGWPLSVWLTPDLEPFFGGTYFPPQDRYGRPGFQRLLEELVRLWKTQQGDLLNEAKKLTRHMKELNMVQASDDTPDVEIWKKAFTSSDADFDERHGGFGSAPKFPLSMELSFLLRYHVRTGDARALHIVEKSLKEMAKGGIFDQIGGGFHRYSTDERWLVPHFEKMLYDNALLSRLYLEAYQVTHHQFYADIADSIFAYISREMISENGTFFSAQDADSEGIEGKYYVWDKQDIERILDKDIANIFCDLYGVSDEGNWEGQNILYQRRDHEVIRKESGMNEQKFKAILAKAHALTLEERMKRVKPGTDTKILTSWNCLMISSFVHGFRITQNQRYLDIATRAMSTILRDHYMDGIVLRTPPHEGRKINGFLTDYAYLVSTLVDLYETTFDLAYLKKAIDINELMTDNFWDSQDQSFYFTSKTDSKNVIRNRNPFDNALPSGNSVAVHNLLRLAEFTGNEEFGEMARTVIKSSLTQIKRSHSGFTYLMSAMEYLFYPVKQIVVSGDPESSDFKETIRILNQSFMPTKILAHASTNDESDPLMKSLTIFKDKISINNEFKIYVCENYTCKTPFDSVDEFKNYLNNEN